MVCVKVLFFLECVFWMIKVVDISMGEMMIFVVVFFFIIKDYCVNYVIELLSGFMVGNELFVMLVM